MPEHSNHPVSQVIINAGVQNDCSNKDELYTQLADAFKQRPSLNKNARDNLGKLPIHYAAENYNLSALEWLFDPQQHPKHKADVNTQTVDESTALSLAVQFANPADEEQHTLHRAACVDFLLAKGADFSAFKYKALQVAARAGNLVFLKNSIERLWFLKSKLNIELATKLLSEAIQGTHQNVISYLLDLYKEKGIYAERIQDTLLNLLQTKHPKSIETVNFVFTKAKESASLCRGENYFTGTDLSSAVINYSAHVVRTLIELYKVKVTTNILVNAAGRDPAIFAIALSHYPIIPLSLR